MLTSFNHKSIVLNQSLKLPNDFTVALKGENEQEVEGSLPLYTAAESGGRASQKAVLHQLVHFQI